MSEQSSQSKRIVIGVMAAVVLVLVGVVAFLLGSRSSQTPATETPVVAEAASSVPAAAVADTGRVTGDRLAAASRAALGKVGSVSRTVDNVAATERAARLIDTPFGPVLLTEVNSTETCHACVGYVGAYYLKEVNGQFEVTARYPTALSSWGWGTAPEGWRVVDTFTQYPALYAEGGYVNQGYATSGAAVVELTPSGPKTSAIDLGSDNSGAVDNGATSIEGHIANIAKGRSFDVVFTGTCSGTQRYTLQGGIFKPAGTNACAAQLESSDR